MIDVILLAAGNSRRFCVEENQNQNKLLYPWKGKSLIRNSLEKWSHVPKERLKGGAVFVVARETEVLEMAREYAMIPVYSPESEKGISFSIRNGLQAAGCYAEQCGRRKAERYVFAVTDQPMLTERTIERFLEAVQSARYACMEWDGETGNPVSFPADAVDELLKLSGDCGGKKVLRRHWEECTFMQAQSGEELRDIDTFEDLLQIQKKD